VDHDACYRAISTRDARFDGKLFTGSKTTGIYCRPVCPARMPRKENVVFFFSAAAAQDAGFRPVASLDSLEHARLAVPAPFAAAPRTGGAAAAATPLFARVTLGALVVARSSAGHVPAARSGVGVGVRVAVGVRVGIGVRVGVRVTHEAIDQRASARETTQQQEAGRAPDHSTTRAATTAPAT
jgi:hypothetical protein